MNKNLKNLLMLLICFSILCGCTNTTSSKKNYDPAANETVTKAEREIAINIMNNMGSKSKGFNAEDYLDTEQGKWVLKHFKHYFASKTDVGYNQASQENYEYWSNIGMKKEYFPGDDVVKEWSVFTPKNIKKCIKYPVVFVMHAGGSNILMAENMGFVEDAAENGYIVVCPSWANENMTSIQEKAFLDSGMKYYEAYAFKTIYEKVQKLYNIDNTKVYCAGFSGGGNASAYVAIECPELIAGTSPATGAAIQTTTKDDLLSMSKYGMPMMMVFGEYDAEERWPITHDAVELGPVSTPQTLEERIDNVNAWHTSCGAIKENVTIDSVRKTANSSDNSASTLFGLKFDKEFIKKDFETTFSFGDLYNKDGNAIVRYMFIESCPHFIAPNWAKEVYSFFSHYSRDSKTNKIIFTK